MTTPEDYGKFNLTGIIKGLEKLVDEKGADYVLIDNISLNKNDLFCCIEGQAQLLLWNELIRDKDKSSSKTF
jgi:hypothetical protein